MVRKGVGEVWHGDPWESLSQVPPDEEAHCPHAYFFTSPGRNSFFQKSSKVFFSNCVYLWKWYNFGLNSPEGGIKKRFHWRWPSKISLVVVVVNPQASTRWIVILYLGWVAISATCPLLCHNWENLSPVSMCQICTK